MFQPVLFPFPSLERFSGGGRIVLHPSIPVSDVPEILCAGDCLRCRQKRWCLLGSGIEGQVGRGEG